jgi:hypothetical protein
MKKLALLALGLATAAASAQAQSGTMTPTGLFGTAPFPITFGGTGIPTNAVTYNSFLNGGINLALAATPRFDNAPVTNNGAGTYFANAGPDACTTGPSCPGAGLATWNFNYHVSGSAASQYNYRLYYYVAPNTNFATAWTSTCTGGGILCFANTGLQNSSNLGFNIIDQNGPFAPNFNAALIGTYGFALVAYQKSGTLGQSFGPEVGRVVMNVSTVPEPSTYALMATGFAGLAALARRRRRASVQA